MISKLKIHKFLGNRNEKNDHKLDVAVEVIQDFLNCDPPSVGKLQADTYDHIDKVYDEEESRTIGWELHSGKFEDEEISQEEWLEGYRKWKYEIKS